MGLLLLEGTSMILIAAKDGRRFDADWAIQNRQFFSENYRGDEPFTFWEQFNKYQIHPFFGFVGSRHNSKYNDWGFMGPSPVFADNHSDEIQIALLGASVAWELGEGGVSIKGVKVQ